MRPLDHFAFTVANLLVNNPENAAVMEITVMGPYLEIQKEMDIALAGAQMKLAVNNKPMEPWRSIRVKPGDTVTIGQVTSGCRAYLPLAAQLMFLKSWAAAQLMLAEKLADSRDVPCRREMKSKSLTLLY